jgi:NAD-dependent dihydropyrimidine dehydrogenase PreA subunit
MPTSFLIRLPVVAPYLAFSFSACSAFSAAKRNLKMYFPKIDPDKCKNHGDCFRICPEDVFDMDDENRVTVARPGDCTKCDSCVMVCPENAITVDEL